MSFAMAVVVAFLFGLVGVFIVGLIALFSARWFTSERRARISAFSFTIGYAMARFSFSGRARVGTSLDAFAALGGVAALLGLWMWLLREADAPSEDSD